MSALKVGVDAGTHRPGGSSGRSKVVLPIRPSRPSSSRQVHDAQIDTRLRLTYLAAVRYRKHPSSAYYSPLVCKNIIVRLSIPLSHCDS